jgi:hypothetical protein
LFVTQFDTPRDPAILDPTSSSSAIAMATNSLLSNLSTTAVPTTPKTSRNQTTQTATKGKTEATME